MIKTKSPNGIERIRTPNGIERIRRKVIVTHNLSEIDQNQVLLVRFPNLGRDDVIMLTIDQKAMYNCVISNINSEQLALGLE